ncbi:MAG: hypothetical protein FWE33_04640 [Defluviitaleaceae bacterium]|nr:hypothetical protein [Defluviitaleaceae bacterium]
MDKDKTKKCEYCGGGVEITGDPILPYICTVCGEHLLPCEIVEVKGAKSDG